MSDNAAMTAWALLAALCFGGFLKCAHEDGKRDAAQSEITARSKAQARVECVRSGRLWFDREDTCIPRCVP